MDDNSFDQMDKQWAEKLKGLDDRPVSPEILKNFSADVETKIRERERQKWASSPAVGRQVALWAPAFAVILVASIWVLRLPVILNQTSSSPLDITEEIVALKEVGAWTEADDATIGVQDDSALEALEKQ